MALIKDKLSQFVTNIEKVCEHNTFASLVLVLSLVIVPFMLGLVGALLFVWSMLFHTGATVVSILIIASARILYAGLRGR